MMNKSSEKLNNREIIWDEWTQEELNELKEEVDQNISLSEIWKYDNEWHFTIKEEIKWEDEKGSYIEIKWNKYYDSMSHWDGVWLWYSISNNIATWVDTLYIWNMNWLLPEWKWTEFYWLWWKYTGERKNWTMDGNGYRVLSDGSTFSWLWKEWYPITWKFEKHKNWGIYYTYEWKIDQNRKYQWKWKIVYSDGDVYEWNFVDWKKEWKWVYNYSNWDSYDWERKNWIKNWHGKYTFSDGNSYFDWEWKDWKENWEWIYQYSNWDKYEWLFINWRRFYQEVNEQQHNYVVWWDDNHTEIEWYWKYTHKNWKVHEFRVVNWTLTEESNSFILMYWDDNKPNENWWANRWPLIYSKKKESDSKISYSLKSWWYWPISWELNGWYYQFKSKNWKILSIPKTSEFWENGSLHVANIINFCLDNARRNRTEEFDYKWNTLQADQKNPKWSYVLEGNPGWSMVTWNALTVKYDKNATNWLLKYIWDTDLLENVPKHFWWISAKELAEWLNTSL